MTTSFEGKLRRPADAKGTDGWTFVVLPKEQSDRFARRGRIGVDASVNGHAFQGFLEPDGKLSHWLKIPQALVEQAGAQVGAMVTLDVQASPDEMEPTVPAEFLDMLNASPEARITWDNTTTIARIDWVHWIESAKQAKTRVSRMHDAIDMLGSGKKRVCCFDSSGYYSKSLSAPQEA